MNDSDLINIEHFFHQLVITRSADFGVLFEDSNHQIELPSINKTLIDCDEQYIGIPGMYGGFNFKLVMINNEYRMIVKSWSRIYEGSGQIHHITRDSCILVEEGYV
ncbi:MAG: hypothetical protein RBT45_06825 [Acholeplasmataceae bacterium]|jgi:hypothetical protein|nr:hypothetical protein [Acholeplasmataceae bacterium]